MPAARSASSRKAPTATVNAALSTGLQSAYGNLLGYVNGMRKCCDMTKFYETMASQGDDFIADSIQHANEFLANYASSSKLQQSPSKMAGEMLKTPSRRKAAARTRGAAAKLLFNDDPFSEDADMADKENNPSNSMAAGTRATRSKVAANPFQQRLLEAKEQGDKGKEKAVLSEDEPEETHRPALGEVKTAKYNELGNEPAKGIPKKTTRAASTKLKEQPAARVTRAKRSSDQPDESEQPQKAPRKKQRSGKDNDSIVADETMARAADHTMPKASTPPPPSTSPKKPATRSMAASQSIDDLQPIEDAPMPSSDLEDEEEVQGQEQEKVPSKGPDEDVIEISDDEESMSRAEGETVFQIIDSRDEVSKESAAAEASKSAAAAADQDLSTIDEQSEASAGKKSSPAAAAPNVNKDDAEAQSKKAEAARNALLASKLMQQSEPVERPIKRTLSSFGAKKSLPSSQHAAAALPASTPAGPGFRSSFLNKSLRKRIEDSQAKDKDQDEDEEEDEDDDADNKPIKSKLGQTKLMAVMTMANTRANAAASASTKPKPTGLKRKSEDDLETGPTVQSSDRSSPPAAKQLKEASGRLGSKAATASSAAKSKVAPSGPASKLEMFRNNLATVTRNGGGVSLSSSSAFARQVSASSPAKPLPAIPPPEAMPFSDPVSAKAPATKLYPTLPESKVQSTADPKAADAQVMAPPQSPGKVAPSSPVLSPPRSDSVRKAPTRTQDRSRFTTPSKASQTKDNGEKRLIPTSPTVATRGFTSPTTASRGVGLLFGSPSRLAQRNAIGTTTPAASPGPKAVQTSKIKFLSAAAESMVPTLAAKAKEADSDDEADSGFVDEKELGPASCSPVHSQPQESASQPPSQSQPRNQNTQLSTQFFDASSRPQSQKAEVQEDGDDDGHGLEGELTLEDLSRSGPELPKSPEPVARPVTASPKKVMAVSQQSRLNGSVRAVPPSAPNGKPLGQQQQLQKNGSINKPPSSKLPTASIGGSQPSVRSSSSTVPSSDSSTPSGGWGISAKIKGLLGFQSVAQPQPPVASSSQQPRPCTMSISQSTNAFTPQLNNSQSSAKPASLARAEMLRRKEAEEAERKAKEKDERKRMVLAAKEKRAKAALEEEQEKEKKKRFREENDRAKRDANDALPPVGAVKSKFAPFVVDAKKRKMSTAEQQQPVRPASVVGQAPKMVRTVSQSSIVVRPPQQPQPTQFKISTARPPPPLGAHVPGQPIRFGNSVAGPSTGLAAANAAKQQVAAAVARASTQNPFQQAQMQKPPPPPQPDEESIDEALPDVNSEYSDSDDEETIQRRATHPAWTQGESLHAALVAQATVDADEIFGIPQGPVRLEEILPSQHSLIRIRRPRSSSANWSGPDGLAQWEIDRYNHRLGIRGAGVLLQQDRRASQAAPRRSALPKPQQDEKKPPPPPPPGAPM